MEETNPKAAPVFNIAQLEQWLAEWQEQLMRTWMAQQQETQTSLICNLSKVWVPRSGGNAPSPVKAPLRSS